MCIVRHMPGPFTPTPIAGLPAVEPDHYYDTPHSCTEALLKREVFGETVWEPAAGKCAIVDVLESNGYDVRASDLVDRGTGRVEIEDFLATAALRAYSIVTNPPFKLADEFVLHAFALGAEKLAIFQRLTWIEGGKRYDKLWSKHPPVRIWAFSARQTLWRGDDPNAKSKGGTIAFAWFVWERGYTGAPSLGWIR